VVVWTGFSAIVTAAQWAADRSGLLSAMMASANPWLSGVVLVVAGVFQFSPLKRACLSRCRSPMAFLLAEWRPGPTGAFVTGLRHGAYCVGCCWVLMALFFVFGTMNLVAAAGLAALVLAEKMLPGGAIIGRVFGIGFIAAGAWVLLRSLA
jgi:predicted metal-binding membrane protein